MSESFSQIAVIRRTCTHVACGQIVVNVITSIGAEKHVEGAKKIEMCFYNTFFIFPIQIMWFLVTLKLKTYMMYFFLFILCACLYWNAKIYLENLYSLEKTNLRTAAIDDVWKLIWTQSIIHYCFNSHLCIQTNS